MGPCRHHWIRAGNGQLWAETLFFSMFHEEHCAAHAAKQNPEFSLHVSDLGSDWGYYYMAQNSPLRPNRIRYLPLYLGRRQ